MNKMSTTAVKTDKVKVETIAGSEAVIKSLLLAGVETIFGYPGGAIMPIYDSLYAYEDRVTHVLTRHEQGAVHAAQGYSRASGKTGVCFATREKKWIAYISLDGKQKELGRYKNIYSAQLARKNAEHTHYNKFSPLGGYNE